MRCPFCEADKDSLKVIDSRTADGGRSIRRRRECLHCHKRFTTYERVEERQRLTVIKKDGRRVPWDRDNILRGLERACYKLAVPESELLRIVDEVEDETFRAHDREAPTSFIGQLVVEKLRRLDQVAYVRFASVYRRFSTLEDLVALSRAVIEARHYDDPGQGTLFVEPVNKASEPARSEEESAKAASGDGSKRRPGRPPGAHGRVPRKPARAEPVRAESVRPESVLGKPVLDDLERTEPNLTDAIARPSLTGPA